MGRTLTDVFCKGNCADLYKLYDGYIILEITAPKERTRMASTATTGTFSSVIHESFVDSCRLEGCMQGVVFAVVEAQSHSEYYPGGPTSNRSAMVVKLSGNGGKSIFSKPTLNPGKLILLPFPFLCRFRCCGIVFDLELPPPPGSLLFDLYD